MRTLSCLPTALALGLALSATDTAHAAPITLTFQQGLNGYTGTQDTIVRSNETASGTGQSGNGDSRNSNFGSLVSLSIDGDDGSPGSKPNQGLIRFDNLFGTGAGQIGAGDTILSATLTLQVFDVGSGLTVHNLLTNWNASTATWNSLGNGLQVDGVELGTQVLASFGANNSSANGRNGHPSEATELPLRPVLTVQVQAVPEAQSLALALAGLGAVGAVGLLSRRRVR